MATHSESQGGLSAKTLVLIAIVGIIAVVVGMALYNNVAAPAIEKGKAVTAAEKDKAEAITYLAQGQKNKIFMASSMISRPEQNSGAHFVTKPHMISWDEVKKIVVTTRGQAALDEAERDGWPTLQGIPEPRYYTDFQMAAGGNPSHEVGVIYRDPSLGDNKLHYKQIYSNW